MLRLRFLLVFLWGLSAVVTACASEPDLDWELKAVRSWTATVLLTATQYHARAITRVYAAQIRAQAGEALATSQSVLRGAARTVEDRNRVRASIDSLTLALRQLDAKDPTP